MRPFMAVVNKCLLGFIMCACIWGMTNDLSAKTYRLTVGAGVPADPLPFAKELRDFWAVEVAKRVEAETDHQIEWTFHFAGSVAKLGEEFEAVEMGMLDVAMVFPIFENPQLFIHNYAYFAPFGTSDIQLATKVNLKVYDNNPWLKEVFEKKYNQKWLGTFTYEPYNMVTNFSWKTIEDLKNHKIAAAGPNLPWIETIGCVPVQASALEVYTGLQTGVFDGYLLPDSGVPAFKLHEVANYFADVGFGSIAAASITINLDIWNSLPESIQTIMQQTGREYSFAVARAIEVKNKNAIKTIRKMGMTHYELPVSEKAKWIRLLGDLADQKAKKADSMGQPGSAVLKDYIYQMSAAGYKWPVKWEIK